jgi:hypothetical protein
MEVPRQTLETIYADIVNSIGYKTTVGPVDKSKVERRLAGERTELPSARLAKAAWRIAALLTPLVPPPPPPPTAVLVAPKTVNTQGGSDQRFCMRGPGVVQRADGFWTDQSGAVYARNGDGLEESSVRNKDVIPGLVGAKEMDGRSACECPTVGSAALNTGSWKV